jgi:hypothetical protein
MEPLSKPSGLIHNGVVQIGNDCSWRLGKLEDSFTTLLGKNRRAV